MISRIVLPYRYYETLDESEFPTNTSFSVGNINGSASVSLSGAANYVIPIDLPPARNGLKPNLSLVYNSQGGDGLLGLGWSLSGLSAISRVPTDFYHEGYIDPVDFDSNDKYSLDGQRLIPIGGDQYRTENESFSRITMIGNPENPGSFKVETKEGLELRYGYTSSSSVEAQGRIQPYSFNLDKVLDKNGNYYTIAYNEDQSINGEAYPVSINYSCYGYNPGNYFVEFGYETRPFPFKTYIDGSQILINKLLNLITIKFGTTIVCKFQLVYQDSKLVEIIKYGKNDARLNSTYISWGVAEQGLIENTIPDVVDYIEGIHYGEFNGDGRTDMVQALPSGTVKLYLTDTDGNLDYISETALPADYQINPIHIGDYNGDGMDDILLFRLPQGWQNYALSFLMSTGSGFTTYNYNGPYISISSYYIGDFNGNGKSDLMVKAIGYYNCLIYEFDPSQLTFTLIGQSNITWAQENYSIIRNVPFDMNGDGKTEIMVVDVSQSRFYGLSEGTTSMYQICSNSKPNLFSAPVFGDFNGDGMTDIFCYFQSSWYLLTSKGNGFEESAVNMFQSFDNSNNVFYSGDINGDGKSDIIDIGKGISAYDPVRIYVAYSNGQTFNLNTYTPTTSLQLKWNGYDCSYFHDFTGDGVTDIRYENISEAKFINIYRGRSPYLISGIENGFGYSTHFNYLPLTNGSPFYEKGSAPSFPVINLQVPIYAVSSVSFDNPDFTHNTTTYNYYNARLHRQGKGFLGFQKITSINATTNFKNEDEYEYDPIYFNISLKKKSLYHNSVDLISEANLTNTVTPLGSLRFFAFVDYSTETNSKTGVTITKDYTYDTNGNLTFYREDYDDNSYNTISNSNFSDAGTWLPSKPQIVTKTQKHFQDPQVFSITNTITYYTTGQIHTNTTGPLTTTYAYDSYGNLTSQMISDGSITRDNHYTYDSENMFVWKSYNALDHVIERTYDYATGNLLTEKSPEGLITNYTYNDFGSLVTKSTVAIGESQTISYGWTTGSRPTGSVYYKQIISAGDPTTKEYYDYQGKLLRTETTGFDGSQITVANVYNTKGQISEVSLPFKPEDIVYKTIFEYDVYGRKIKEESNRGIYTTTYGNKTITVTSNLGQSSTKTFDSQGNMLTSGENIGTVTYSYKSIGKPGTIVSNNSSWIINYDNYGRQTSLNDPNTGLISYGYNNFGELTTQTDASRTLSFTYDQLGRIYTQVTPEGTKTYHYDPANSPGSLDYVEYPGGTEDYDYDNYGRLTGKILNINGIFFTTFYSYDGYNRLENVTYPSGYKIKNVFNNYGYHSEVRRVDNAHNDLIWRGDAMNSFGQFTQTTYGNSLVKSKDYDALGILKRIKTGSIQDLGYDFNRQTGNLTSRNDYLRNLSESFSYDNINRLTGVTGPASMTMTYLQNGNIDSKTLIGTYTYNESSRPHAVRGVTNPNGVISRDRQDIEYNSSNQPDNLIQGTFNYSIGYGYDDQRITSSLSENGVLQKTVYYIGEYEREDRPGNHVRQLHYISGGDGLAAIFVRNDGIDTLYYIHTDHLGSINVITNQNGAVVKTYSFDAWGRRRNPNDWTYAGIPSTFLFSRGFTGHEHLDKFDLINMNGRLYDPLIARFLSPDNFVQAPGLNQSFNRYSYCLNNPLIYTDPSGEIIFTILAAIFCPPLLPVAIAADIGGAINLGSKALQGKIHSFGDGVAAYGIGAGGGALAYVTGGAALGAAGAGGFIGGAAAAGTAYTYGTMFTSMGNSAYFGDPMPTAKQFITGAVISMATGGLINGTVAALHGRNFWTGAAKMVPSNWQSPPLNSDIGKANLSIERPEIKALQDNHSFTVTTSESLNSYTVEGNTFSLQRPSISGYKPFLSEKLDLYHNFPKVLDPQIVQQGSWAYRVSDYVRYNNIGQWFEAPGIIDGVRGVYQIGINESGIIFHRAFIPFLNFTKMPKAITIKDVQGFDVLKFENIKLMYDDDFKRIVFQLTIDFEIFKAKAILDAEESDFMSMKECLEKIYNKKWETFILNPIGEQFSMQFNSLDNNQIKVLVKLSNPMFTGKLEFEFKMNSIYVPDLLKEIETVLKE